MIENVEKSKKTERSKKNKKNKEQKKQKENRKRKRKVGSRKVEVGAEGALMKSYRKPGRSSREEGYWLTEGCVACTKKCMERDCRQAEGDIGRKFYKLSLSCRLA